MSVLQGCDVNGDPGKQTVELELTDWLLTGAASFSFSFFLSSFSSLFVFFVFLFGFFFFFLLGRLESAILLLRREIL